MKCRWHGKENTALESTQFVQSSSTPPSNNPGRLFSSMGLFSLKKKKTKGPVVNDQVAENPAPMSPRPISPRPTSPRPTPPSNSTCMTTPATKATGQPLETPYFTPVATPTSSRKGRLAARLTRLLDSKSAALDSPETDSPASTPDLDSRSLSCSQSPPKVPGAISSPSANDLAASQVHQALMSPTKREMVDAAFR